MTLGRIHSIETLGLLDGPGIRSIIFMQGCPLKCLYCHNADTQKVKAGTLMTPEDLVLQMKRFKPYFDRSGGGVTFSGGEPLIQGAFLVECLKQMKAAGIHTAIDTSGFGDKAYFDDIVSTVDYILLDLKHTQEEQHMALTGVSLQGQRPFLEALKRFKGKICFRHVMVPGCTDSYEAMDALAEVIVKYKTMIDKIEILPYHKMGTAKFEQLGHQDPLHKTPAMDHEVAKRFETYLVDRVAALKEDHHGALRTPKMYTLWQTQLHQQHPAAVQSV